MSLVEFVAWRGSDGCTKVENVSSNIHSNMIPTTQVNIPVLESIWSSRGNSRIT